MAKTKNCQKKWKNLWEEDRNEDKTSYRKKLRTLGNRGQKSNNGGSRTPILQNSEAIGHRWRAYSLRTYRDNAAEQAVVSNAAAVGDSRREVEGAAVGALPGVAKGQAPQTLY